MEFVLHVGPDFLEGSEAVMLGEVGRGSGSGGEYIFGESGECPHCSIVYKCSIFLLN